MSASALTNFIILASVPIALGRSVRSRSRLAWVAVGASVLNAYWWVAADVDRADLEIGYYLWWASFAVLAYALAWQARAMREHSQA